MGTCLTCGEKAGLFKKECQKCSAIRKEQIKQEAERLIAECYTYELICHLVAIFHDKM